MIYTCKECNGPVVVENGNITRQCGHMDSPVLANVSADTVGISSMSADRNTKLDWFGSLLDRLVLLVAGK